MAMQTPGQQAVTLWEALTGKAVVSTSYGFSILGQQFSLYDANKRIQQALAIGDDLITTLIIKTLLGQFAEAQTFSLAQILNNNAKLESQIGISRQLHELFNEPAARRMHEDFYLYAERAIAHHRGIEHAELPESTRSFVRESGCFVGLDAVTGLDKLTRLMICDGAMGNYTDAKLSRLVFGFENIEQLISHAHQIPTGFSLCTIVSPRISDSYFVLVVRNGQRILVLTDRGNYQHPLQEERMAARNDRYNASRIDNSHFPYSLLNIQWADKGRAASDGGRGTMLMDSACGLRVIGTLCDLDDLDLLWLQLCIDQCRQRYFDQQQTEPQLATGAMFRLSHKWSSDGANLPVPAEFELHLDIRTSAELNSAFLHTFEPAWAKWSNPNLWMEKRFADKVPDDCLYIPASALNEETPLLAADPKGVWALTRDGTQDLDSLHAVQDLRKQAKHPVSLRALNQTALSTRERVIADAHFIARANQAQAIKALVEADYRAREEEVQVWFYKAAQKNLPNLIDDLLCMNHRVIQINTPDLIAELGRESVGHRHQRRSIALEYIPLKDQFLPSKNDPIRFERILKLANYAFFQYDCYLVPYEKALLFMKLSVETVQDIMNITGLPLTKIPQELHHRGLDSHTGNPTLDRIDPLSTLHNPWDKLKLAFRLPLSLKGFKVYRKRQGLDTPNAAGLQAWAKQTELEMHPPRPLQLELTD